jgi:hypothetical protein
MDWAMMKGVKFHASSYMRGDPSLDKSNLIVVIVAASFKSSVSWGVVTGVQPLNNETK